MRYIVYDTETSGLNTTFDQILQFAAVLADDDLHEIDSLVVRCRRLPHIVPSPGAMLVTGVKPVDLEQADHSFHEMMMDVNKRLVAWSKGGAVFLGYNSLRFDESLLRQALYQNLLPVYLTNTGGNIRGDVLRIAQACAVHYPGRIVVPTGEDGAVTFRLGAIAVANGVVLDHAHEALADARATLAVARVLRERVPDGWRWMLRLASKRNVETALRADVLCLTEWYFGMPHSFMVTPASSIGGVSSEVAMFDLAQDPAAYLDLKPQALNEYITGEAKAFRRLRTNAQPMLFPAGQAPENVDGGQLSASDYAARARRVRSHPAFRAMVTEAMSNLYADQLLPEHVEQLIYEGFPSNEDRVLAQEFHEAAWPDRPSIARRFRDRRLRALARRMICIERPGLLSTDVQRAFDTFVASRVMADGDVPWMTVSRALAEVEKQRETTDPTRQGQLAEIEAYIRNIGSRAGPR